MIQIFSMSCQIKFYSLTSYQVMNSFSLETSIFIIISWLSFSGNTNPAGLECEAFATTHNLTQFVDFPTRIPDNTDHNPHHLDFFLTNLPHSYTIDSLPPIGSSDHILLRAIKRGMETFIPRLSST